MTLARHGVPLRGKAPDDNWIASDLAAAQAYSRANLEAYWRPWIARLRESLPNSPADGKFEDAVAWSVLGISRLHGLIAEGNLMSKTVAGRDARNAFPAHAEIIDTALALRAGRSPAMHDPHWTHQALLACLEDILTDGLTRPAARPD